MLLLDPVHQNLRNKLLIAHYTYTFLSVPFNWTIMQSKPWGLLFIRNMSSNWNWRIQADMSSTFTMCCTFFMQNFRCLFCSLRKYLTRILSLFRVSVSAVYKNWFPTSDNLCPIRPLLLCTEFLRCKKAYPLNRLWGLTRL